MFVVGIKVFVVCFDDQRNLHLQTSANIKVSFFNMSIIIIIIINFFNVLCYVCMYFIQYILLIVGQSNKSVSYAKRTVFNFLWNVSYDISQKSPILAYAYNFLIFYSTYHFADVLSEQIVYYLMPLSVLWLAQVRVNLDPNDGKVLTSNG